MAKLKYDRPINISARSSSRVQIPNDEVWKVTTSPHNSNVDAFIKLYGGVQYQHQRFRWSCIRHRLQAHRRVNGSMEVVLHG